MATEFGGYFCKAVVVRPKKLCKYPRSRACLSVDNAGENNAAWANATSSAGVAECTAECAAAFGTTGALDADWTRLNCQSPELGVRVPCMMQ